MTDDADRPARNPPRDADLTRRAEQLVGDINAQLAVWHVDASTITARKLSRHAEIAEGAQRHADTLKVQVTRAREQFSAQLAGQDSKLREHSKVIDVLRALDALLQQLDGPL